MSEEFITPFSSQALRLMREKWANPTQLAEEVFAVFQKGIPTTLGKTTITVGAGVPADSPSLELNNFGAGDFVNFNDQYNNSMFRVDTFGNVYIAGEIFQVGTTPRPGEQRSQYPLKRPNDPKLTRIKPQITWAAIADIVDGTPLSSTQLNAIAADPNSGRAIPGDFTYDPANGTVLAVGPHALATIFTPRDRQLYLRANATNSITVTPAGILLVNTFSHSVAGAGARSRTFTVNAGELILVSLSVLDSSTSGITFGTIDDTDGNVYTQIDTYVRATSNSGSVHSMIAMFWAVAVNTGTFTFHYTPSASCDTGCRLHQISGADATVPIRAFSSNFSDNTTANPLSTGNVAASAADAIFALFDVDGDSISMVSPGYSLGGQSAGQNVFYDLSVAGSIDVQANTSGPGGTHGFVAFGVALKPI